MMTTCKKNAFGILNILAGYVNKAERYQHK